MWTSSKTDAVDDVDVNFDLNLGVDVGENRKISIGYISAAHGVKGEVRLVALTDYPERFAEMPFLDLYLNGSHFRSLRVKRVREHGSKKGSKGEWIVESDVPNRDEAEKLVGSQILIDRGERVPLAEGNFWVDDLIGLTVQGVQDGQTVTLGVVEDFVDSGGSELYVVRDEQGKRHYIPAVEAFVKDIDLVSRKITVKLIEGLWE